MLYPELWRMFQNPKIVLSPTYTHTCSKRSEKFLRETIASWKLTATGVIWSAKSSWQEVGFSF